MCVVDGSDKHCTECRSILGLGLLILGMFRGKEGACEVAISGVDAFDLLFLKLFTDRANSSSFCLMDSSALSWICDFFKSSKLSWMAWRES